MDLLVSDSALPRSLCRSLDASAAELANLAPGPDSNSTAAPGRLAGRRAALVHYDWPDREDKQRALGQVGRYCLELHHLVAAAYFHYPWEGLPPS